MKSIEEQERGSKMSVRYDITTEPATETNSFNNLGIFADPAALHDALDICNQDVQMLLKQLRQMVLIRKAEEKIGDMVTSGMIKCPCHLGIGQEAIAVGISSYLRSTDRVFGAHRSHTHFLALNNDVYSLFAEVLGKVTGCSRGMGGSMHLMDKANGFWGSVPIVAASVPIATGAALAAKLDKKGDVAVSYFGDGAVEEGALQESLNLASVMNLPIIFVCENNLFASHMHISQRQPLQSTARFAQAHGIPAQVIDGNDILTVANVAREAVERSRDDDGPFFIEAITYRWRGHVGPREDIDVGVKRKDDLNQWKLRDPIQRLVEALIMSGNLSIDEYNKLRSEVQEQVESAWLKAEGDPFPEARALLDLVYYDGNSK